MLGSDTARIIAAVTHEQTGRNWPDSEFPHETMGAVRLSFDKQLTVALGHAVAGPEPTVAAPIYLAPEPRVPILALAHRSASRAPSAGGSGLAPQSHRSRPSVQT